MIITGEELDTIKPVYREYLAYMGQFFIMDDSSSWCDGALKNLKRYATKDDHYIYVAKESDSIVGFALVNTHRRFNDDGFAVAEFYIHKDHQKKGYGRSLAEYVFAQFPGPWEVSVSLKNHVAREFWLHVVSSYTQSDFIEKRNPSFDGSGFVFNNKRG